MRVAMVVPPQAVVFEPAADLRASASDDAELVDQVHYREHLRVLASRDGWHHVQAEDHYFGWVRQDAIGLVEASVHGPIVDVPLAAIRRRPDRSSEVVGHLPAGTPLTQQSSEQVGWAWVDIRRRGDIAALTGYVSLDDSIDLGTLPYRPPTPDDLIATAEAFVGVPYLWGGTTGLGLDCSGYVQQVYGLNGLRLDRDADQQALEGRAVDRAARGDLVFFGRERVTHVGLARDALTMLNARGGRQVEVDDIDDIDGIGVGVLAIRRYLP
ncbi:MAG: C40 family peptidase [Chloroflexi bacterium]|nr:C40 family peptidase [Chloroflexota bacterium]